MNEFFEHLSRATPAICVAMIGAAIQCLRGNWRGWKNMLFSLLAAGFGAFLAGELMREYGIPHGVQTFVMGMIGWSGGAIVDDMLERARHLKGGAQLP